MVHAHSTYVWSRILSPPPLPGLIYCLSFMFSINFNTSLMGDYFTISGPRGILTSFISGLDAKHVASLHRLVAGSARVVFHYIPMVRRCLCRQWAVNRPATVLIFFLLNCRSYFVLAADKPAGFIHTESQPSTG